MKSMYRLSVALLLLALFSAACIPVTTPAPTAVPATAAPAEVEPTAEVAEPTAETVAEEPTAEPEVTEVTLKVWDILTSETEIMIADQLNREFEEANPGVTIEREFKTFDQMKSTAKLGLSAADGPDVAQINQGYSDMGALVGADLLVDLGPYAEQYGWKEIFSPGIVARNSFSTDGKNLGEGNWYAIPITAELVGVFYNKAIFQKYNLEVPKTFAEFEQALQTITDGGDVAINYGSLDGFVNIHVYAEIQNVTVDRKTLDDFIYSHPGATFNTPENLAAAETFMKWVDAGYFTKDFSGIGYDDSVAAFRAGSGAMMITGSWISGDTITQAPETFGFFLMPGETEGALRMSTAGTSTGFAIRKGSPNQDLAAKYIDWLVSDRAAQLWADNGVVPVGKVSVESGDPLFIDLINAWAYLNDNDLVGHFLDWATPTFYDTLNTAFAEMLAKQITPQEAIDKLEKDYADYLLTK